MTKNQKWGFGILLGIAILLFASYQIPVQGSAPSGLPAVASSSPIVVATSTITSPVASSTCAARIISTASTTIMVGIGNMVPTAVFGYFQAASTTKEYDGGLYGCGAVKIFPFQTGVITISDTF